MISGAQVLQFWRTTQFDDEGVSGTPSIVVSYDEEEKVVSPQTIRAALQMPIHPSYSTLIGNTEMKHFLTLIGCQGSMDKLG